MKGSFPEMQGEEKTMGTASANRQDLRVLGCVLSMFGIVRMRLGAEVRQTLV